MSKSGIRMLTLNMEEMKVMPELEGENYRFVIFRASE